MNDNIQKAVIYCRVSSAKQTSKGDGLNSQQTRCREYAKLMKYEVVEVFSDDITGALATRPAMKSMLAYLRKRKTNPHIVIIDDISRLARSIEAHLQLRSDIDRASGILKSPSVDFGDDSDSVLVENLLASVSQHQRQKNAEQTVNRMRARSMNGYWVFRKPVGYRFEQVRGRGKVLVRDEPAASILQEALEGFASGRFDSQVEIKRFLDTHPDFPKNPSTGRVRHQLVKILLEQSLYAGMIEVPNWDIPLQKAQHEGIISFETYERIQQRLHNTVRTVARRNLSEDFPLRGFVNCGDCNKPLTACWSKGKTKLYPYYLCYTKKCSSYRKSVPKRKIEEDFGEMLQTLKPSRGLVNVASILFKHAWQNRWAQAKEQVKTMHKQIKTTESKINLLIDRIVDSENQSVIDAYEKKITKLEREKLLIAEKAELRSKPQRTYETMFELAINFLSNPYKLWVSKRLEDKRTALKLVFADPLTYHRYEGFRTPKISLPFKVLDTIKDGVKEMASPRGFEPLLPP